MLLPMLQDQLWLETPSHTCTGLLAVWLVYRVACAWKGRGCSDHCSTKRCSPSRSDMPSFYLKRSGQSATTFAAVYNIQVSILLAVEFTITPKGLCM